MRSGSRWTRIVGLLGVLLTLVLVTATASRIEEQSFCENVPSGRQCSGRSEVFGTSDLRVHLWMKIGIGGRDTLTAEWRAPTGNTWTTQEIKLESGGGYYAYSHVTILGSYASLLTGTWAVNVRTKGSASVNEHYSFSLVPTWDEEDEPNDAKEDAHSLSPEDAPQFHGTLADGDSDWYRIRLPDSQRYYVSAVSKTSYTTTMLTAYQQGGTSGTLENVGVLGSADKKWGECASLKGPGTCYVRVSHPSGASGDREYLVAVSHLRPSWAEGY